MGKVIKFIATVAVLAVIAVYAPVLGTYLYLVTGISAAVGTAIATAAIAFAANFAMTALAGTPKTKIDAINFRNAVSNSFIIIGKRRQGGKLTFYHPRKTGSTHWRYFIFSAAGHRCKGVTRWYLNDEVVTVDGAGMVTSGKYANNAWLWFGRGSYTTDETPAVWRSETGGKWSTDHVGYGVAKIYFKARMTKDIVAAGMPTVSAEIEGSDEIYDPRDGTTGYSRNATLATYWWMQLPREEGGFGAATDEMPDGDLIAAWANVCDEECDDGYGGVEARYAFDSVIEAGAPPSQIRETFVICCAGSHTYSEGAFLIRPGYWEPPSYTLEERDLAAGIRVSALLEGDEVLTEASGSFVNPADNYQPAPIPTRSVASADIRQGDFDLAHITSHARGQRILEIMLRRARCEKRLTWPGNIALLETRAMQCVLADKPEYGISNYAWLIDDWSLASDFGITLQLREENAEIYEDPELLPMSASAAPDMPEDIPSEADSAASAGEVADGTYSYNAAQIKGLEDRIAALEP